MARSGDILGLGDAGLARNDHDEVRNRETTDDAAKRHRRMNEGADELVPSTDKPSHQGGHGATGIDMGAGGEGTDVE